MLDAAAKGDRYQRPGRVGDELHPESAVAEIFEGLSTSRKRIRELEERLKQMGHSL